MITQLIWTIWTSLSAVPSKAVKFNYSLILNILLHLSIFNHILLSVHTAWLLIAQSVLSGHNPEHAWGRQQFCYSFEITSLCCAQSKSNKNFHITRAWGDPILHSNYYGSDCWHPIKCVFRTLIFVKCPVDAVVKIHVTGCLAAITQFVQNFRVSTHKNYIIVLILMFWHREHI